MESNYRMTELIKMIKYKGQNEQSKKDEYKIRHFKLKDLDNGHQLIDLVLSVPEDQYTTEIYYYVKKIDHVLNVEIENL